MITFTSGNLIYNSKEVKKCQLISCKKTFVLTKYKCGKRIGRKSRSKEAPERTAEPWAYLLKAGLKLNLAELKKASEADNFGIATTEDCISEDITFTNCMIGNLKDLWEVLFLFKFVKAVVPYSVYKEQFECMEFYVFRSKLQTFEKHAKKERKKK